MRLAVMQVAVVGSLVFLSFGVSVAEDISLGTYQNGILKEYVTVEPGVPVQVVISDGNLPPSAEFVVFQCHTQKVPVTVSASSQATATNSVTGNHVGLVVFLANATTNVNGTSVGWVFNNDAAVAVMALVVVVGYSDTDPVPGGCNMEFSLAVSPYMRINYTEEADTLEFQRAGYASGGGFLAASCDLTRAVDELRYEVFYYDLPEKDVAETTFFSNLEVMVSAEDLRTRGVKAKEVSVFDQPRVTFNAFPGLGMLYGIVAYRASNYSQAAAYVPLVTYSCRPFVDGGADCNAVDNWFSWTLCAAAVFIGALLVVRGHRYFRTQLFLTAFAGFSFASYIVCRNYVVPDHNVLVVATMACGVAGGLLWIALWRRTGAPFLVVLMPGLVAGALLGSILLYTPLVNYALFRSDVNYWAVFGCCAMLVPIALSVNPKLLSVLSSTLIGAFAVTAALDRYLGGTLVFSVINVVRRAVIPGFQLTHILWPVQLTDVLLLGAWVLVTVLGVAGQLYFETGRPPFPPNSLAGEAPTETSSLLVAHGAPDREPLLFPDYQSSRPSSGMGMGGGGGGGAAGGGGGGGGGHSRTKRFAAGGGRAQQLPRPAQASGLMASAEDAVQSRDTATAGLHQRVAVAGTTDYGDPPPPYYPPAALATPSGSGG